jgi:threonine synthase
MLELYHISREDMQSDISAYSVSDDRTRSVMKEYFHKYNYILDPHGAVGVAGWEMYENKDESAAIILETAHPAKFIETVQKVLNVSLPLPEQLQTLSNKVKKADLLSADFALFKDYLLSRKV